MFSMSSLTNSVLVKNHALAGAGHMGKETVFDGIVFGTVGRIMSHANFDPHLIGEVLQVLY